MRRANPAPSGAGNATGRGDLGASLALIFPLLLAYEVGVLFVGRVNGADIVTRALYTVAGSRAVYLLIHVAIAVGFLVWIRRNRRGESLRLDVAMPVILEASIYAFTLGTVVSLIVDRLLGLGTTGASVVSALGAGVHEELVFRLGLIGGSVTLASHCGMSRRVTVTLAIVASSVLFALAHHAGAGGESWSTHAFAFRCFAGAAFALIFWFRSLAHAVYAHVLYDLIVAISR